MYTSVYAREEAKEMKETRKTARAKIFARTECAPAALEDGGGRNVRRESRRELTPNYARAFASKDVTAATA